MKTIYIAEKQWQDHSLSRELDRAVGDTGRTVRTFSVGNGLPAGEDKVIDLAAWKAENLVELEEPETLDGLESGLGQYEGRELVRRRHRKHDVRQARIELAATLAVVGVMAALILRVLVF